ncbi:MULTISPECIES: TrlF family AAA-like ATPase [Rhizobium]|uniref:TrlF family AAA-like ATPase n=1 Tax=Rhizobium TaxID=379 RepID=UPI00102FC114|nr:MULTISPECIES: AAA family ATPase [Rhizobium]TAX51870.1 ATP-binding protein [Rhizobium leguminosarum]TBB36005.1 ATP-binding protein [Rhizobium ruizarguesonis]TCB17941.1 ATP-binding protein [Rhizobium leguminosarum bv. viciae]
METKLQDSVGPGSLWARWEPHVHAPGTIFNDLFKGDWDAYLTALETATPAIRAIGVTDYYGFEVYNEVRRHKAAGRLPKCDLIFPNIEVRFSVGTAKAWINAHLLIRPDGEDHLEETQRFLRRLQFKTATDSFACEPADLVRLGRKLKPDVLDDRAALRLGSEQFKVSFDQLRDEFRASSWAQDNVLIAVAGSKGDGTSGLQDGADQLLRQEIERFAHIIFASTPSQREFWLGRKTTVDHIRNTYGDLKPCMHGSDGHSVARTAQPDGDRFSWIKGAISYDSLKQACIDPEGRAYVGVEPPPAAAPSETISTVTLSGADWVKNPVIQLNPGLVTIIGARGSGKTALADIIATGCDAHDQSPPDQSFLVRANEHLQWASVTLEWGNRQTTQGALDTFGQSAWDSFPRARYLTQQFVDSLCSSDGMTDGLLAEVERVIFDAHSVSDREGAVDFSDLREIRADRHRQSRLREEAKLEELSDRINVEIDKQNQVPGLKKQIDERTLKIKQLTEDRAKLATKGSEERIKRLEALTEATNIVRNRVRSLSTREQKLLLVQDTVSDFREHQAPEAFRDTQDRHRESGITSEHWDPFLTTFSGDVDDVLKRYLDLTRKNLAGWRGEEVLVDDPQKQLIADDADLGRQTLRLLEAEVKRLSDLIAIDKETRERFKALSDKIVAETETRSALQTRLDDCEGAKGRLEGLPDERERTYTRIFQAAVNEQQVLSDLYRPIRSRMDAAGGTLLKLSFSVVRKADVEKWSSAGEKLLDLRKQGSFRGEGKLLEIASEMLKGPWEKGSAEEVTAAIRSFRAKYQSELLQQATVARTDTSAFRKWLKEFALWLYDTSHISVNYTVDYDGVDIRKLSPGTRGIVLLLLYLALDDADQRPLIIDQPEENLDPKSIYDELVGLFIKAKAKRQVIMVTHNANLVINTDADQVIVASSGPHPANGLPEITYVSGGLEDSHIRKVVCDILEGGEHAFRERARRLRVRLDR